MVEHDHVFKPESADKLISEERKEAMPADSIIELMDIEITDVVADLGAGNGYFTLPLAKKVKSKVYAVDAEPKMFDLLKSRAKDFEIENIAYVHAAIDEMPIADDSVNKVLISRTIHHAPSVLKALQEIKRILKNDGQLYIIEFHKNEAIDGPPLEMRLSPEDLTKALSEVGFDSEVIELNDAEYAVKAKIQ